MKDSIYSLSRLFDIMVNRGKFTAYLQASMQCRTEGVYMEERMWKRDNGSALGAI